MFIEKKLLSVAPVLFTSNGTDKGLVTVNSIKGFFVKQKVTVKSISPVRVQLLEIKRVISDTQMLVGPPGQINAREDLSVYTISSGASIEAAEQDRPGITTADHERAVYVEEPVVAKRQILVDEKGDYYNADNRLPVNIDADITIAGDINVQLTHKDNDPNPGDIADSVRLGNGVDLITGTNVGAKKALDVYVVNQNSGPVSIVYTSVYLFNEINSVPINTLTTVQTYTVPAGKEAFLQKVQTSGENIAKYYVLVNSVVVDLKRTYFGSDLNTEFDYIDSNALGLKLFTGDVVQIQVIHSRDRKSVV